MCNTVHQCWERELCTSIVVYIIFNLICIASLGTTSASLSQVISQFQDHTSQQPSSSDDQPRERLDSPILSRNVDSVEEQISLNNGEQYSSFSSSAEHSPQALTDEPTQNRIQTDYSGSPKLTHLADSTVSSSYVRPLSSRVSSPFHVPASQAAEPEMHKAAEAMKSLRKATVNRFTHAPSLPKSQEELQPTNSVFVPVQAMQDHPSIPLQVATTETHTEPPASSTSHALVHADSFQTRVNDRNPLIKHHSQFRKRA